MIPQPPQIPDDWKPGRDWTSEIKEAGRSMAASRKSIAKKYQEKNLEAEEDARDY
jgi:hypothetical protein